MEVESVFVDMPKRRVWVSSIEPPKNTFAECMLDVRHYISHPNIYEMIFLAMVHKIYVSFALTQPEKVRQMHEKCK